ncbi:WecB/TagA/CpsF family glycosyltransferase [Rhizobium sp. ARZ01]|uniref:WecB/TagA/CpsF family glycosyltransferase n=1 Tax=Rhizobium sp. ARZ01 TaxID=2769313 RepID=UPI00177EE0A7|nr:WecB/TagA/CpsF family glycosyltransferase [Rhizobium sp. ARZ01]MBD9373834.1 WecB/TagA/CpsF family glycosyltransferase [Rhizobium sp. ARZ01]
MNLRSANTLKVSQRDILGLPVYDLDWAGAFDFVESLANMPIGQTTIAFLNANDANLMMSDTEYRDALARQIVLPDGHVVGIASQVIHGNPFPANLNGKDFVPALLTYMEKPKRIALIGADRQVLSQATEKLREHTPWHEFHPISDGHFDHSETDTVTEKVRALAPDILLVAMTSPVQEKWIDRHVAPGHARLVISVGSLFDHVAGQMPSPPARMHRLRFEWLFRLINEPRQRLYRFGIGNTLFLYHVARYKLSAIVGHHRRKSA